MARRTRLTTILSLLLAAGSALSAQETLTYAFKMGGGPVDGSVRKLYGDAGFTFGADFEIVQPLAKGRAVVYNIGYRALPGDNRLLSFIPGTLPAGPTSFETRNRLTEGESWGVTALYRMDVWMDDFYVQGGLKAARTKVSETDTGTTLGTTGASPQVITSITAIASKREVTSTSIGLVVGAGYRFTERYSLELNLTQLSAESAATSSKSGLSAELSFAIRF